MERTRSSTEIEIDRLLAQREAGKLSEKECDALMDEVMADHNACVDGHANPSACTRCGLGGKTHG